MRLISMISPALALCLSISSLSIQTVCNQNISCNLEIKATRISVIMLSCLRITLVSSSIMSILMLASFPLYKYIYQESFIYYPLLLCIPLLFLSNTSGVMKGYLEANNDFSTTYFSNLVESLTKVFASVLLLLIFKEKSIHFKVILIFSCLTLSELSSNLVLSFKIKHKRKIRLVKTNSYEKVVLRQAIPLTLSSLSTTIGGYLSPFVFYYACNKIGIDFIESTTSYALVSSYAIPLLINGQYGILSISKFIFPSITKTRSNPKKQGLILDKSLAIGIIISVFSFGLCFFQSEFILKFMYNDITSATIVRFLAPIYLLIYLDPILIVILQSYQKEQELLWISIISQAISILGIYFLSIHPFINTMGYCIGISIGAFIKCIFLFYFAFKASKYRPNKSLFVPILFLSFLYVLILRWNSNLIFYWIISAIYILLSVLFFYSFYKNKSNIPHLEMHK